MRIGLLLFGLLVAIACSFLCVSPAYASPEKGRHVYVVFDDSTSMVGKGGAWCEAQYALECFVAMLGENDTLTIYPMSAFSGPDASKAVTTYKGSDPAAQNVERVREGDFLRITNGKLWNADTVFRAAEAAYEDMASNLGESRLIILTDGEFYQAGDKACYEWLDEVSYYGSKVDGSKEISDDIEAKLRSWGQSGAQIYYLALGEGVPDSYLPEATTGLEVEKCTSNDEIIEAIIKSCNWAFKRASLDEKTMPDGKLLLPLKKVIVFAQGDEAKSVSIPNLDASSSGRQVDVLYPTLPDNSASSEGTPSPNTSLSGRITTVSEEYPRGDSSLSDLVSQSGVEVYYEPNAVINISLVDGDGWEYDTTGDEIQLKKGSGYTARFSMCDPETKEPLDLGDWDAQCSAVLELDGNDPIEIKEGEEFSIPEGTGQLSTSAVIVNEDSGAEVGFNGGTRTTVSSEKTIWDWICHFWYVPLLLLIIAAIIAAVLIWRKHRNAPRLPDDLYPELYDGYSGEQPATLKVEALSKKTPFFGAETQTFDLVVDRPYSSNAIPPSITVRATDKKGNMVIDNWGETVELAKQCAADVGEGGEDCIKLGSKRIAQCDPDGSAIPLTLASKMKFAGSRDSDEALIELRFRGRARRNGERNR